MKFTFNRLHDDDWVVSEEGGSRISSKHQLPGSQDLTTPVHDVIDIKCIKNTYLNQKCIIIVGC